MESMQAKVYHNTESEDLAGLSSDRKRKVL